MTVDRRLRLLRIGGIVVDFPRPTKVALHCGHLFSVVWHDLVVEETAGRTVTIGWLPLWLLLPLPVLTLEAEKVGFFCCRDQETAEETTGLI